MEGRHVFQIQSEAEMRAQRWHDTDHGESRCPGTSSCWCCCTHCDPDWNERRPNPYFADAQAAMRDEH